MAGAVAHLSDGRSYTHKCANAIRQTWCEKSLDARVDEFSEGKFARVFCGTYNVNAKKEEGSLDAWLAPSASKNEGWADIYAVGFQEIVDLNAINVAIDGSKTSSRSQFWVERIAQSLRKNTESVKYILVSQRSLVGLLLCVYVKESLLSYVQDVRTASTAVGVLGVMGNKGGVSCRFSLYDSSICFVCSHLAAHRDNVSGRNADFANIMERTIFAPLSAAEAEVKGALEGRFPHEEASSTSYIVRPLRGHEKLRQQDLTISDHDMVFWLGDLNYRIDEGVPTQSVFDLINRKQLVKLAASDQLTIERAKGTVFSGFEEGPVSSFAPTYKYAPGTDHYDRRNPGKVRAPAWCDRVLWRCRDQKQQLQSVTLTAYDACDLLPSDHKPVMASFQCRLLQFLPTKERVVFDELQARVSLYAKDLQALAVLSERAKAANSGEASTQAAEDALAGPRRNSRLPLHPVLSMEDADPAMNIPEVSVSTMLLEFETARFQHFTSRSFSITNSGKTLAHWRIANKLESAKRLCKRWLHLDQTEGLLFPGETVEVNVHCFVDSLTAHRLNAGREGLEDLIVVRVEGGVDSYIAVSGNYLRSCYGMSLQELVLTHTPARETLLPPARSRLREMASPAEQPPPTHGQEKEETLLELDATAGPAPTTMPPAPPTSRPQATGSPSFSSPGAAKMSVPKELWRLVDDLWSAGGGGALKERDLFSFYDAHTLDRDVVTEVTNIREALDTGAELPSCSPQSIIASIFGMLLALPKPLLPPELCPQTHIEPSKVRSWSRGFLHSLPPLHYNVFVYLLSFLREVLTQGKYNRATPTSLASFCVDSMTLFSPSYRLKQQSQLYHTLGGALNRAAERGATGAATGVGDTTAHSNPLFTAAAVDSAYEDRYKGGRGGLAAAQSLKDDGTLEMRRRALGAVLEYLLVTQEL